MNMEEFIALTAPDRYDFSNDGANGEYHKLDNFRNDLEKFFAYMALGRTYKREEEDIMKYGADYSQKCKERYTGVKDPDSGSTLLREIYSELWDESNLRYCRKEEGIIQGETMNTPNTTLDVWYKFVEEIIPMYKNERERVILSSGGRQRISIRYILSRYIKDTRGQSELFDKVEGMRFFVSIYHTLGNFIPVPADCNAPRGFNNHKIHDYWDLTLKIIYDYYVCGEDNIKDIVGESRSVLYKQWLDSFREDDSKKGSWKCFVEKNYLQDFVDGYDADGGYGMPKELWEGHFTGEILPAKMEQIEQFYVNASSFITARSTRMLLKLRKIRQHQGDKGR